MSTIAAYDYDNQCWLQGEPARQLLVSQLRDEISLLLSHDGEAYAKMLGTDRDLLLQGRQSQLAILVEQ